MRENGDIIICEACSGLGDDQPMIYEESSLLESIRMIVLVSRQDRCPCGLCEEIVWGNSGEEISALLAAAQKNAEKSK